VKTIYSKRLSLALTCVVPPVRLGAARVLVNNDCTIMFIRRYSYWNSTNVLHRRVVSAAP
jgi:hypothetical protein